MEYEFIFSVNFFPRVSDICEKMHKKYISWTVDSPLIAMFHESVFNECNYIFIFDKFSGSKSCLFNSSYRLLIISSLSITNIIPLFKTLTLYHKIVFYQKKTYLKVYSSIPSSSSSKITKSLRSSSDSSS